MFGFVVHWLTFARCLLLIDCSDFFFFVNFSVCLPSCFVCYILTVSCLSVCCLRCPAETLWLGVHHQDASCDEVWSMDVKIEHIYLNCMLFLL